MLFSLIEKVLMNILLDTQPHSHSIWEKVRICSSTFLKSFSSFHTSGPVINLFVPFHFLQNTGSHVAYYDRSDVNPIPIQDHSQRRFPNLPPEKGNRNSQNNGVVESLVTSSINDSTKDRLRLLSPGISCIETTEDSQPIDLRLTSPNRRSYL